MSRFFHRSKPLEPDPGHSSSADPLSISNSTPNQRATTDNDLGDTKEILNPAAVTARDLISAPAIDDTADPIERRYLVRKPQAHQWFENDVLMKAPDKERVAGKFELFFDLLYVALVSYSPLPWMYGEIDVSVWMLADRSCDGICRLRILQNSWRNPTGGNVAVFLIIFATGWHAWADLKEMMVCYYSSSSFSVEVHWLLM